ncbi:MAG: VWA domain-containing protein [Acidimicrobiales bacterium]|nr:VWA domain-containing protein [Acidimicrobiales bacterium]
MNLPFSAVVGQEDAKLALLLTACDPRIGGVLLRGDKGSAKSTLARGLAAVLPGHASFVELPIGATEDRVVGTLDITAALAGGEKRFEPGLLHAADGGVLYVDEINLLPDHLVDLLLDVAASGVNRVEREGISHSHPSRFLLVGSMNPEEGDLRPQLLDRFGLAVDVRTPADPAERAAALRRRLAFDGPAGELASGFEAADAVLAGRLATAHPALLPDEMVDAVAGLCASVGAEGLRADLTICRAAAALAGWEGRDEATADDVRRVAPLALAHRARRNPFDPAGLDHQKLADALDEHVGAAGEPEEEEVAEPVAAEAPAVAAVAAPMLAPAAGRRTAAAGPRGRIVGDRAPSGPLRSVAVGATVRQAASRRAADPQSAVVEVADLREAVREQNSANLIVLAVDASGSMGARSRMELAKGAVMALLQDAYQRRDLVALVAFRGEDAEVLLRPTGSVEVARARLSELPTGGRTPLAAGLRAALDIAASPARAATHTPLVVLISDARATFAPGGQDASGAAWSVAEEIRRSGITSVVVDAEHADPGLGASRLGLAAELAEVMGARYIPMSELTPAGLGQLVRGYG